MKHFNITVRGVVQGVNFRHETRKKAIKLGIFGLVRNQSDGSVYIEAEGDEQSLKQLVEWCKQGPWFAKVSGVDVDESSAKGYDKFVIDS